MDSMPPTPVPWVEATSLGWTACSSSPGEKPAPTKAATAATHVLIVTEPRASSVDGVAELTTTISTVQRYYNPSLTTAGILINRWRNDRLDRAVWREELRAIYGSDVIDHPLPEREVVAVAATNHVPVPKREAYDYVAAIEAIARHFLTNQSAEVGR